MNRVALVTGASRGIGRGISLELAKAGHDLIINFAGNEAAARRTATDCVQSAREQGYAIQAVIRQANVGSAEDREKLIDFARKRLGRLDLLVNNAGISSIGRKDILEAVEEDFDRLMAVNLKGPFFLSQLAANWMIEQRESLGESYRPKIVTISSISAYAASTNRADYCIAKAGLGMMTKLYAVRLAEYGIQVYEIRPGIIESDMTAPVKEKYNKLISNGLAPIRRWGKPEDIGKAVAAVASDAFPFSTGEVINVDGGFHIQTL